MASISTETVTPTATCRLVSPRDWRLVDELTLGVVATSGKEDEHRLPIHPRHVERIDAELRSRMFLEHGYGQRHGYADAELAAHVGGLRSREQLIAECDVVVLPKPVSADLAAMRPGQVLWGWPHCVQDAELTQLGIDRRLTVIAWEAMNHWTSDGAFSLHVFHMNNELAGYCSVLHALQLRGTSGHFGPQLRAAVISFGATARGAVAALLALGVHEVTVLTHRNVPAVASPMPPARLVHYDRNDADPARRPELTHPQRGSLAEYLARHDIVVNCILQDTDDPLMFVTNERSRAVPARQPDRRRVLRRGHGLRVGPADVVRRADLHGRAGRPLLRRRPQPVVPVELAPPGRSARR